MRAATFKVRSYAAAIARALDPHASKAFSRSLLVMYAHYYPNPKIIGGNEAETIRMNLQWLKEHCSVIPLTDGLRCLERRKTLPKRAVALVVDDAATEFTDLGLPILLETGIPYSLAVISGFVDYGSRDYQMARFMKVMGGSNRSTLVNVPEGILQRFRLIDEVTETYNLNTLFTRARTLSDNSLAELLKEMGAPHLNVMNRKELKNLMDTRSVDLVSHTMSHPYLRYASGDWLEWETDGARRALEGVTERPGAVFVYSYGWRKDAGEEVVNALRSSGYRYGLLAHNGVTTAETDRYRIPRVDAEVPESVFRKNASTAGWAVLYGRRRTTGNSVECLACSDKAMVEAE